MSEQHRLQVMRTVRDHVTEGPANPQKVIGSSTQQIEVPANPQKTIEDSTTSLADGARMTPTQRKHYERKAREGKTMKGSFEKLRARVQSALANGGEEISKASRVTGGSTVLQAVKVARPSLDKTIGAKIDAARATMAKALGGNAAPVGATSLEAGYNSDSATLAGGDALRKQSLPKKVFVKMEPAPLTGDQITKAASAALSAGAITGAEANTIATHVALNGGKHCDPDLLKKIGSHVK